MSILSDSLLATSKCSLERTGSYAYATGVYESLIATLYSSASKHMQEEVVRTLQYAQSSMIKTYGDKK